MPRRRSESAQECSVRIPRPESRGEAELALHFRCYSIPVERQYRFCPTRKWAADFCLPDRKLVIEVDGMVHRIKERFIADIERSNWLALNGWTLLRYSTKMVIDGTAIRDVLRFLGRE